MYDHLVKGMGGKPSTPTKWGWRVIGIHDPTPSMLEAIKHYVDTAAPELRFAVGRVDVNLNLVNEDDPHAWWPNNRFLRYHMWVPRGARHLTRRDWKDSLDGNFAFKDWRGGKQPARDYQVYMNPKSIVANNNVQRVELKIIGTATVDRYVPDLTKVMDVSPDEFFSPHLCVRVIDPKLIDNIIEAQRERDALLGRTPLARKALTGVLDRLWCHPQGDTVPYDYEEDLPAPVRMRYKHLTVIRPLVLGVPIKWMVNED